MRVIRFQPTRIRGISQQDLERIGVDVATPRLSARAEAAAAARDAENREVRWARAMNRALAADGQGPHEAYAQAYVRRKYRKEA